MQGSWGHVALVGEELASDAALDKVLRVRSGCRPIKPSAKHFANEGPSCSVVSAGASVNFCQQLPPFFFGDTSLKYSSSAFLVEPSFVDLIGL